MGFQLKLLEKAYFIVKMTVWPWSGWPVLTFGKHPKTLCEPMTSITLNLMVSNMELLICPIK